MSIQRSIFEEVILESNDQKRSVDIRTGVISIDYYEDIFSPTITARVKVVNDGNTIPSAKNPDGESQSIYNGLPLRGGERVSLKISGNSSTNPGLNFSDNPKNYLYVSSITDVISQTQRETFTLHLVSREAITNETSRVSRKYPKEFSINQSVNKILEDYLKADKIGTIEKTSNNYGFIGNMRKPFTVLVWLASKGVPSSSGDATAGFVFYQTRDGFQFRSLDSLIGEQTKKAIYTYYQTSVSYNDQDQKLNNDFKILTYLTEKNQNLIEKLRLGTYASQRMFFNPYTFKFSKYEEGLFKYNNYVKKVKNLGEELKLPPVGDGTDRNLGDIPSRIITGIYDVGTLDQGVSKVINSDQTKYQSQSLMRYNTLFTQTLSVTVPSNTNLRAGDLIECKFPRISRSDASEYDPETSGLYMIKELCHHFDVERSYTSMKLVKDTFGLNKKS